MYLKGYLFVFIYDSCFLVMSNWNKIRLENAMFRQDGINLHTGTKRWSLLKINHHHLLLLLMLLLLLLLLLLIETCTLLEHYYFIKCACGFLEPQWGPIFFLLYCVNWSKSWIALRTKITREINLQKS